MSSISIQPATRADIMNRMLVAEAAFKLDKLHQAGVATNITDEHNKEYLEWRAARGLRSMNRKNNHHFNAVDDHTGNIIGAAAWCGPDESVDASPPRYGEVLPFMNQHFYDELAGRIADAKKTVMGEGGRDYWELASIYVLPEYQGRGIASRLLKEGLEKLVDRDGLECYLEASDAPSAKAVYERHGFQTKLEFTMLDGEYTLSSMVREASSSSKPNSS